MLVLAMQFSKNLFESPDTEASPESGFPLSQKKEKTTNFLFFSEIHPVGDSRIID